MNQEINPRIEKIIKRVQKPLTYIACEDNAVFKKTNALNFCLVYPDVYELAINNLGINILYSILNKQEDVWAQRAYMPDIDMIAELENAGESLFSLEEARPLNKFDIIGFSLPHELSYPNILKILSLSRIPTNRKERTNEHPVIIAGGHGAFNPKPMSKFIDAFIIGDGEDVVLEITQNIKNNSNKTRQEKIQALRNIEGVWVSGETSSVNKRTVVDLNEVNYDPLIPTSKGEKRKIVEIMRGCTAGCRFCQAGFICRPLREKQAKNACKEGMEGVSSCGLRQISLLSLSTSDYSQIRSLVSTLSADLVSQNVSISLPSLRPGNFSVSILDNIKTVKKTGLTFAIEAGSQRLRDLINKNLSEEQILKTMAGVFERGWNKVKLYFMIGLPTETQKDLEAIVGIINLISDVAQKNLPKNLRKKLQLTISISNFVPKPHTPFQWVRQDSTEQIRKKQKYFTEAIRGPSLNLRWHNCEQSEIEGIIARGDEKIAEVIENAYKSGALFNNFSERFDYSAWSQAAKESGVSVEKYLDKRRVGSPLPWDLIKSGVKKEFLEEELERAIKGNSTEDCRDHKCPKCGVCEGELKNRFSEDFQRRPLRKKRPSEEDRKKYRLILKREGRFKYLSHLEWIALVERNLVRTGLTLASKGKFNPRPKLSFSQALPVSFSSEYELVDFTIFEAMKLTELKLKLQKVFMGAAQFNDLLASPAKMDFATASYSLQIKNGKDEKSTIKALAHAAANNKDKTLKIEKKERFLNIKLNECILKSGKDLSTNLLKVTCPVGIRPDALVRALAKDEAIDVEIINVTKTALDHRSGNGK